MNWDDPVYRGERGEWTWIVSRAPMGELLDLVIAEHIGARLWICTFDSGTITPNAEEKAAGWTVVDGAMVSPSIQPGLDVPCEQYDEWYIFEDARSRIQHLERFVNYGGFNLADPKKMEGSFDPSWERGTLEYLYPLQARFWAQLELLRPISYIGCGDKDVVVTRNLVFAARLRELLT